MRYLLDTHSLSNKLIENSSGHRNDLFVLEEIISEYSFLEGDTQKVLRAGIKILSLNKKHLEKMKEIMATYGDNFKLIRLFTSEGAGDVAMLAYVIAEKDKPDSLFSETYTLVTQDKELSRVAEIYGIPCVTNL